MAKFKKTFKINPQLTVTATRISYAAEVADIKTEKLIPIQNSAFYLTQIDDKFFLPRFYAAMTYLTGEHDDFYDSYKGSYSFTFYLKVQKYGKISTYCYLPSHIRDYVEYPLYQIVPITDPRDPQYYCKPNDELFSDEEICDFTRRLYNYAFAHMRDTKHIPKSFVKGSDSNLLLFGYDGQEFFMNSYDNCDEYNQEKERLESVFPADED